MIRVHATGYLVGDETWSFNIVYTETIRAMIRNGYNVTVQHGTPEFQAHVRPLMEAQKLDGWAFSCGCPDTLNRMPMKKRSYYCYWGEHHIRRDHVDKMNTLDLIFVNSTFSRNLLQESGVIVPIGIIYPGIDERLHTPSLRVMGQGKVKFLFVGQQWRRKGLDSLAVAWKPFEKNKVMGLTIKLSPNNQADLAKVKELFGSAENVTILMDNLPKEHLAELYKEHDVFLFPSRSEGFGIPVLEALACGLLPIATRYGGYLDFCTPANSILVPVHSMSNRDDGMDVGQWANIDTDALSEAIALAMGKDLEDGKYDRASSVKPYTYDNAVHSIKNLFTL